MLALRRVDQRLSARRSATLDVVVSDLPAPTCACLLADTELAGCGLATHSQLPETTRVVVGIEVAVGPLVFQGAAVMATAIAFPTEPFLVPNG